MKALGAEINHRCVIFDVDGTLLSNEHRVHHLHKEPKDWEAFGATMHEDTPIEQVVMLARLLRQHFAIVICTGRMEKYREVTTASFRKHDIWHDMMFMRPTNDHRPDAVVKRELLDEIQAVGFHPQFVVEDRNSVVKMWREAGLVCLQCAEGDF